MRQSGLLIAVVGLLLFSLAAGDALAGAELGGRGDDALRGSGRDDRLAGYGGDSSDDAASVDMLDRDSHTCETVYAA